MGAADARCACAARIKRSGTASRFSRFPSVEKESREPRAAAKPEPEPARLGGPATAGGPPRTDNEYLDASLTGKVKRPAAAALDEEPSRVVAAAAAAVAAAVAAVGVKPPR